MTKVTCIIPAYNEEKNISCVINAVINNKYVGEVIVINDCSSDKTGEIVHELKKVKIFHNNTNKGKSRSVLRGIKNSKYDLILLLDADLINLSSKDVSKLLCSVITNKADVSISYRQKLFGYDFIVLLYGLLCKILKIDILTGERVFNKNLIDDYNQLKKIQGFGLEVFINKIIIDKKLRLNVTNWEGVYSPSTIKKIGLIHGNIKNIREIFEVIYSIGFLSFLKQLSAMRFLSKRKS